jgi:hypothetical protein
MQLPIAVAGFAEPQKFEETDLFNLKDQTT